MSETFNEFMTLKLMSKDMSQRQFERLLSYKDGAFRDVMAGRAGPRLQDLIRMADILSLTPVEARRMRELALEAHGYQDLANELRDLHRRVDGLSRRVAEIETKYKV